MSDDLQLRVDPELKALFDGLGETDYEGLKQDIKKRGFLVPLIVAQDGTVISGHRRFQVAQELGIKAPYVVREFKNKEEMFEVAITDNLLRRQLNNYEKGLLGIKLLHYEEERAKERMLAGEKIDPDQNSDQGRSLNIVAKKVGISHDTLHKVKYIEEHGIETEIKEARVNIRSVNKTYEHIITRQKYEELKRKIDETSLLPKYEDKLFVADIQEALNYVNPNSVDLILTDPLYSKEALPLWDVLGSLAKTVLKEGRLLIAYSGQYYLPEVLNTLSKYLTYVWTFSLILVCRMKIRPYHIYQRWKPILVFAKNNYIPKPGNWIQDTIKGYGREKELHYYQQALGESIYLLEKFTEENNLVLDPFVGTGTNIVAASKLNRRYIGLDHDENAIKTTIMRLEGDG